MKVQLDGKKIFIGGIQGSGKTQLAKKLCEKFRSVVSIRVTPDYDTVPNITLVNAGGMKPEEALELVAQELCKEGREYEAKKILAPRFDCLLIDEGDLFFKNSVSRFMNELILLHRHYGVAIIIITRRPQDIPARIVESCHYFFFFKIEGKNVFDRMNSLDKEIVPLLARVEFSKHNFVFKELGQPPILHKPITIK
jgi:hypothetical protein